MPALLKVIDFRRFWVATGVSTAGNGVSFVAIPLAATLTLNASALEMGLLSAAMWLPSLLLSAHMGALADRTGRGKAAMITADVVRAALLVGVWAAWYFDALTLVQLLATVFLLGVFSTLYAVHENTLFADLVSPDQYVAGQSLIHGAGSTASVAGSTAGGLLVSLVSAPVTLLLDAISFITSAGLLSRTRVRRRPVREDRRGDGGVAEGLRFIAHHSQIRTLVAVTATTNTFEMMFSALVVLFLTEQLHLSPAMIGLASGLAAVGGVLGSVATSPVAARIGLGGALCAGVLLSTVPLAATPLIGTLTAVLVASLVAGFGGVVQDISVGTMFTAMVPDDVRARVRGAFMTVSFGARPAGALLGGVVATLTSLTTALTIAAVGGACAVVWLVRSPVRAFRVPR
ncbi:MFS transporter [Lentzea sp. BCCO 10_0061]|uniref:MFS transporter n=1 Tax=Lentzea sokolovensis TaxID=3095429 RepID=A0ABU4URN0_9PSEU|nr:MFS transporter [Lentzea sp. BCCO 10_0061]MDX8141365.1 MFS transporter [Lentzea sp. BCCO 10_0061]